MTFQYVRLANEIENQILKGDFRAGDRLPSLRRVHQQSALSISTIHQAYMELERRGMIEGREKSGFFVKLNLDRRCDIPELVSCQKTPQKVRINELLQSVNESAGDLNVTHIGQAFPGNDLLPLKHISRIFKSIGVENMDQVFGYGQVLGRLDLRRQIAKRTVGISGRITSEEVVITNGCMDAINLCLRAVAEPGDVIGVESPTYSGFLQLIEQNNMYALELPTHITEGVEVDKLEQILDAQLVKACLFNPTYQNPLGFVMSNRNRQRLVQLMNSRGIPIIEDDVFGDLHFDERRPSPLKAYDQKGLVLYCSSFSKTLAPGLRVGWTLPGAYLDRVRELKSNMSLMSAKLNQHIVFQFLQNESYERQLRFIRNELKKQMADWTLAIIRYFPKDTRISSPKGGLNLWVQLNNTIDGTHLFKESLLENILINPGVVCSSSGKYRNCIRIGCGEPLTEKLENRIRTLSQIIYDLI